MKNYLTKEGIPVISNCPQADWTEVTKEVYDAKSLELNAKAEADKKKSEDDMKVIVDQDKRINAFLREFALKELKEDDLRPSKNPTK